MQNIENYFYTKKIQIPSQVKIQIGNNIITLRGPLGVLELNLKKMDSLCFGFFHVNEKTNELEIYVKKVSKKSKAFFGSLLSFFQNSFHGICQGFLIYLELSGVGFRAILHETMNRRSRVWIGLSGLNASHSNQSIQTMPLIQDGLVGLDRSRNASHLSIPSIQQPIHSVDQVSDAKHSIDSMVCEAIQTNDSVPKYRQEIEFKLGQTHDLFYSIPKNIRVFSLKPTLFCLYGIEKTQITQIAAEIRNLKIPEPYKGKGIKYKDEVVLIKVGKKK
jgi:ribosomal protein L6P/L9E